MSHIVELKPKINDLAALAAAAARAGFAAVPGRAYGAPSLALRAGTHGYGINVVADVQNPGTYKLQFDDMAYAAFAKADNPAGQRGNCQRLLQLYEVERLTAEARAKGMAVVEQTTADGLIRLEMTPMTVDGGPAAGAGGALPTF